MRRTLIAGEEGQDLVEYGLLATSIALTAIAAVQALGWSVGQLWTRIGTQLAAYFM